MLEGKDGYVNYKDPERNLEALFFYDNVPSSNWKIGVQFLKDDLTKNINVYKRKYINLLLALSLVFLLILAAFFNRDYLSVKEIWYLSFFSTVILLGNIFWIGYLQHTKAETIFENRSPAITNYTALNTIVNSQQLKQKRLNRAKSKVVPLGIYLKRLNFEDSYNVNISGTVWLKYPNEIKATCRL